MAEWLELQGSVTICKISLVNVLLKLWSLNMAYTLIF